ncbi:MAG: phosphotransferase family protein [Thermosynechococcaceae cyanobacterium]
MGIQVEVAITTGRSTYPRKKMPLCFAVRDKEANSLGLRLMGLILSADNVVAFLKQSNVCSLDFQPIYPIITKESKNFNLVVRSALDKSFIVKQNRVNHEGKTSGNLFSEWIVQDLLNHFGDLRTIQPLMSEVVSFDRENSTIVSVFYDQYMALDDYYESHQSYHPKIADTIGVNLAKIHRATYQNQKYRDFLGRHCNLARAKELPRFIERLNNLSPSIFSESCPDGLDFYKLYQRFPSLNDTIVELYEHLQPSCLTHKDLTLDNFIVDSQIDLSLDAIDIRPEQIKIIDWEFNFWADPAEDLGMLVSQYLSEWLTSLVADPSLDLKTILSLATCPLEAITPSLEALLLGYLKAFPELLQHRSDFVNRVVQFAGIGIISRLSYYVEYHYYFGNEDICKLQVAKNLICAPEQAVENLFGNAVAECTNFLQSKPIASSKVAAKI